MTRIQTGFTGTLVTFLPPMWLLPTPFVLIIKKTIFDYFTHFNQLKKQAF